MRITSGSAYMTKTPAEESTATKVQEKNLDKNNAFDKRLSLYMHRFQKAAFSEGSSVEPGKRWEQLKQGLHEVRSGENTPRQAVQHTSPAEVKPQIAVVAAKPAAVKQTAGIPEISYRQNSHRMQSVEKLVRSEKSAQVNPLEYWHRLKAAQNSAMQSTNEVDGHQDSTPRSEVSRHIRAWGEA